MNNRGFLWKTYCKLYYIELTEFLRSSQRPAVTLLSEVIILLDNIYKYKQIIGFSKRINQGKRKMLDLVIYFKYRQSLLYTKL